MQIRACTRSSLSDRLFDESRNCASRLRKWRRGGVRTFATTARRGARSTLNSHRQNNLPRVEQCAATAVAQPLRLGGPCRGKRRATSTTRRCRTPHRPRRCITSGEDSNVEACYHRQVASQRRGPGPARVRVARRVDRARRDRCGRRGRRKRERRSSPNIADAARRRRVSTVARCRDVAPASRLPTLRPERSSRRRPMPSPLQSLTLKQLAKRASAARTMARTCSSTGCSMALIAVVRHRRGVDARATRSTPCSGRPLPAISSAALRRAVGRRCSSRRSSTSGPGAFRTR